VLETDQGKEVQKINTFQEQTPLVKGYLEKCLVDTLEDAILYQGGVGSIMYGVPGVDETAVLYKDGTSYLPSQEQMLAELGDYVKGNLNECVGGLDLKFEGDVTDTTVQYKDGKVMINAQGSYRYVAKGSSADITLLQAETEFDYPKWYSIVQRIIAKEVESPDWVQLSMLLDAGLDVKIITYGNDTIIYELRDGTTVGGEEYVYRFANVFGEANESTS
jgi:hypothetical protein